MVAIIVTAFSFCIVVTAIACLVVLHFRPQAKLTGVISIDLDTELARIIAKNLKESAELVEKEGKSVVNTYAQTVEGRILKFNVSDMRVRDKSPLAKPVPASV